VKGEGLQLVCHGAVRGGSPAIAGLGYSTARLDPPGELGGNRS